MDNKIATGIYLGLHSMYAQHLKLMYPGAVGSPLVSLKLYESENPDIACEFLVKEKVGVTRYLLYADCSLYAYFSDKSFQVTNKNVVSGMIEGLNNICYLEGDVSDIVFNRKSSSGMIVVGSKEYISCLLTGEGVQVINSENS